MWERYRGKIAEKTAGPYPMYCLVQLMKLK
jgi:hypothetical protein